jgi:hypothetical protein
MAGQRVAWSSFDHLVGAGDGSSFVHVTIAEITAVGCSGIRV